MTFTKRLASFVLLLALGLLMGCPGNMTVFAIQTDDDDSVSDDADSVSDDDDSVSDDDDDLTPGDDDDDLTPSDDDDTGPGDDDDDDTGPAPGPIAECGPFIVPQGNNSGGVVHYTGSVLAHRPNQGDNRSWTGCEVRRYFNDKNEYQCQVYWSLNGARVEWTTPCSVYVVQATYVADYSDCSPNELGADDWYLDDFEWSYGTEYHWGQGDFGENELSLWSAAGAIEDVPGGPPGGQCGFNGPQGNDWIRWDEDIPFQNWGDDGWEYLEFQYSTDFRD